MLSTEIELSLRDSAIKFLNDAVLFSKKSKEIEANYGASNPQNMNSENESYVRATIISIAAFLEGNINELFTNAADYLQTRSLEYALKGLEEKQIIFLSNLWQLGIPRTAKYAILEKYEITLKLLKNKNFDKGINPYQDVDHIVKLRNYMIHFEPEEFYIKNSIEKKHKFEKMLKNKFPESVPYKHTANPYFPDKCLGYGCAKWAIISSVKFVDTFHSEIGLVHHLQTSIDRCLKQINI